MFYLKAENKARK